MTRDQIQQQMEHLMAVARDRLADDIPSLLSEVSRLRVRVEQADRQLDVAGTGYELVILPPASSGGSVE